VSTLHGGSSPLRREKEALAWADRWFRVGVEQRLVGIVEEAWETPPASLQQACRRT
jgi:hypothetical protein